MSQISTTPWQAFDSELVNEYIRSKGLAWARSSLKNERSRLNKHGHKVNRDPKEVYEELKASGMCNHSIKTTYVRLGQFLQWLIENDKMSPVKLNPWKNFLKTHALLFKHAYQVERLKITYDQAKAIVDSMSQDQYRKAAQQLLEGGLRYCELRTFDGEAVIGKGSKPRNVFLRADLASFRYRGSYSALYVRLKAVGLKPHTLRKLCATRFSTKAGVSDVDVCEVFGWESIETSKKYRQPQRRERLSELMGN